MRLILPRTESIVPRRTGGLAASLLLHAAALAFLMALGPAVVTDSFGDEGDGEPGVEIVQVPRDLLLPAPAETEESAGPDAGVEPLVVDDLTFDVEKIRRRRYALFPFLAADLQFLEPLVERVRADRATLTNPLGSAPDPDRPPLTIDAAEVQRIVDGAWARRDRWRKFAETVRLLDGHDPDVGQAPDLVHAYLDQNLLQPYDDTQTKDGKYWVMMELASDHVDFIDFIRRFARTNPSSRSTVELLFLLEELAEASKDSLLTLLTTTPSADLLATFAVDRGAFTLAAGIDEHYRRLLAGRGITSPLALIDHYVTLRMRILRAILDAAPGGYRNGDARYLIGRMLFERNELAAALETWSAIVPDETDNYYGVYSAIRHAIATEGDLAVVAIAGALGGERQRWLEFSRERLRAFGYRFDTF